MDRVDQLKITARTLCRSIRHNRRYMARGERNVLQRNLGAVIDELDLLGALPTPSDLFVIWDSARAQGLFVVGAPTMPTDLLELWVTFGGTVSGKTLAEAITTLLHACKRHIAQGSDFEVWTGSYNLPANPLTWRAVEAVRDHLREQGLWVDTRGDHRGYGIVAKKESLHAKRVARVTRSSPSSTPKK